MLNVILTGALKIETGNSLQLTKGLKCCNINNAPYGGVMVSTGIFKQDKRVAEGAAIKTQSLK